MLILNILAIVMLMCRIVLRRNDPAFVFRRGSRFHRSSSIILGMALFRFARDSSHVDERYLPRATEHPSGWPPLHIPLHVFDLFQLVQRM